MWAFVEGTTVAWVTFGVVTAILAAALLVKYLWPMKRMRNADVGTGSLLAGGVLGIVGFFRRTGRRAGPRFRARRLPRRTGCCAATPEWPGLRRSMRSRALRCRLASSWRAHCWRPWSGSSGCSWADAQRMGGSARVSWDSAERGATRIPRVMVVIRPIVAKSTTLVPGMRVGPYSGVSARPSQPAMGARSAMPGGGPSIRKRRVVGTCAGDLIGGSGAANR